MKNRGTVELVYMLFLLIPLIDMLLDCHTTLWFRWLTAHPSKWLVILLRWIIFGCCTWSLVIAQFKGIFYLFWYSSIFCDMDILENKLTCLYLTICLVTAQFKGIFYLYWYLSIFCNMGVLENKWVCLYLSILVSIYENYNISRTCNINMVWWSAMIAV